MQYRLERMTDELDELESRGLFSRREISEIVKKRRQFEYRLKRKQPLKQDYLSYIEYESHLDAFRKLRKKSISNSKKWKNSISDSACIRRILRIYREAVLHYKGDVDLWFRYLEFCRSRRHGRMKEAIVQALRFHPKVPGLWIYAAAWEFDHNLNARAARALMQNGLKACPESEDLWVEYLRMELTYLHKLKARKVALGEVQETSAQYSRNGDDGGWKKENTNLFVSLNGDDGEREKENKDLFTSLHEDSGQVDGLDAQDGNMESEADAYEEQGLMFFRTIYSGAIEAIPSSMSLQKRFLEILDEADLAFSEELKEEIMSNIQKDFFKDEDYWDWHARLKILGCKKGKEMLGNIVLSELNEAVKVYDESLNTLPSTKMFSLYARFWLDLIDSKPGGLESSGFGNIADHGAEFTSNLLRVYEKAEARGCLTDDLAHQYVSFYLKLDRIDEARNLAKKLCDGKFSGVAKLWVLRASIEMKCATSKSASVTKNDLQSLFEILRKALSKVAVPEAESLWFMAIKYFSNNKEYFEKLVQNFMIFMARGGGTESNSSVAFAIVNWVLERHGIQHAREIYNRILALPHPSLATYRQCIELESNLAMAGDDKCIANARKLYDSALSIYKDNVGLWQEYLSMEMKVGTSDTANAVYWRSRKTIGDGIRMIEP